MKKLVECYFRSLRLGDRQEKENLVIIPIFQDHERSAREYLLLDEAMEDGKIKIGEVSEGGDVNTLLVENRAKEPVLILDGEELVGAKQNRMVNATILIAAESTIKIPVSCVERGRWRYQGAHFDRSEVFGYATLRREKALHVADNLSAAMSFDSNQNAVWAEIDRKQSRMGARSETDAVHDVYRDYEKELQEFIKGMNPQVNQIGIAVFINDAFNCMDLFSHQDVLERLWSKLLKSYAMEALEMKQEKKSRAQDMESVLAALYEAEVMEYPSVGLGQDIRLKKERFIAAGLIYEENVMHLAAFQIDRRARSEGRIARPSRRQRGL